MKNRRIVVVALMLAAVLCLGAGYAAVTDTIDAEGTITYNQELVLAWTGDVTPGAGETVVTNTTGAETLAFEVDTSDWVKGEVHTFTVEVTNTSTKYNATGVAVSDVTNNASSNYDVTATIDSTTINATSTATVTITIKVTSYPTTEDYSNTFSFSVSNTGVTSA